MIVIRLVKNNNLQNDKLSDALDTVDIFFKQYSCCEFKLFKENDFDSALINL
jgi:hypothetical protein